MSENTCDIRKLADLLRTDVSEDSDDDLPSAGLSKLGPGHIGKHNTTANKSYKVNIRSCADGDFEQSGASKPEAEHDEDAIWHQDEIFDAAVGDERFDPREQPEYDIKYQQAISTEDVFLQMGCRTAATASCENMLISIHMLGELKKAIDLTVTKTTLEVRSPLYRLQLHLPHPVDPDEGHAEWNQNKQQLCVTLRMVREYDFINF